MMKLEDMILWLEMHESEKYAPIIAKLRAAEALALLVAEHPTIDFAVWQAVKDYRKAGSVPESTQKSTPA